MSSEERYGLPKQPGNTCPIIDAALNDLGSLQRKYDGPGPFDRRRIRNAETAEELRDIIDEIVYEIEQDNELNTRPIEDAFEECREQASKIREWGESWKELAKENLDKVESVDTPWAGVMLWWREVGRNKWYGRWAYRAYYWIQPPPTSPKQVVI